MVKPGHYIDGIVNVVTPVKSEPHRPRLCPGDAVTLDTRQVNGDVPMLRYNMYEALEREAFSGGRRKNEVMGWIRTGEVALVLTVDEHHAFLYAPQGRGWIDRMFLVPLQEVSNPGQGATKARW